MHGRQRRNAVSPQYSPSAPCRRLVCARVASSEVAHATPSPVQQFLLIRRLADWSRASYSNWTDWTVTLPARKHKAMPSLCQQHQESSSAARGIVAFAGRASKPHSGDITSIMIGGYRCQRSRPQGTSRSAARSGIHSPRAVDPPTIVAVHHLAGVGWLVGLFSLPGAPRWPGLPGLPPISNLRSFPKRRARAFCKLAHPAPALLLRCDDQRPQGRGLGSYRGLSTSTQS